MTRRHAYLVGLLAAACGFSSMAATAQSDSPAPTQVLPDMRQKLPTDVKIAQVNGQWRLGFASEVANDGPGPLEIVGNGPGGAPMVADQVVQMSDGTTTTIPAIGEMHYVIGGGHEHWHLLDFERYELRSAADPANSIVRDQKTGFCLADAYTTDLCGRNQPDLTTVSEGISVGGSDKYLGYLEGQYLLLDQATVPSGDYLLVNRVNPTGALAEADTSDDAASVRLALSWDAVTGAPSMKITNTCLASIDCPAPPPPPPAADPAPQPQPSPPPQDPGSAPTDPATQSVIPAPPEQSVPIVAPSELAPADAQASLSRSMAGRLVRRAITKSFERGPRGLRTTCAREGRETFACTSIWRDTSEKRWRGHVRVWYVFAHGRLSWYYELDAVSRPGGRRVVTRALKGSASRAFFRGPTGALFCALSARRQ